MGELRVPRAIASTRPRTGSTGSAALPARKPARADPIAVGGAGERRHANDVSVHTFADAPRRQGSNRRAERTPRASPVHSCSRAGYWVWRASAQERLLCSAILLTTDIWDDSKYDPK